MEKQFELNVKGRGKSRKEKLARAEITLPLPKVENEETIIVNPDCYAAESRNTDKSVIEMKVVEINVLKDNRYGHLTSKQWQAGYTVLFDTAHVKYILIDFHDGIEIIVSKIVHPFGVRYYVSVPRKRASTSMLVSLTDTSNTTFNLLYGHNVGFICKKSTEFAEMCWKNLKLLDEKEALTIAEVLRGIGDF